MRRGLALFMASVLLFVLGVVVLQLARPSVVQAQRGCTVQMLRGTYGLHLQGWFYPNWPERTRVPAAQIGVAALDGVGNLSARLLTSADGETLPQNFEFTYQVNPDCTGSVTPKPGSNAGETGFVIVDSGKQLLLIGTSPGLAWSGEAIRQ